MTQTRRQVLGGAAAVSVLPLLGGTARARETPLDIAIIGGGVAGAYAAWRLASMRKGARVRLFETSGRMGGRLRSIAFPQAPHLIGEAGGMRFLEAQRHVCGTVDRLKLPRREVPVDLPEDRIFLRGKNIALKDRGKVLLPYQVPSGEQSPTSDAFLRGIMKVVPDAPKMTPAKWKAMRETYRFKGRLLRDWATWTLLAQLYTWEELTMFQDASGYDDYDLYGNGQGFFDYVFLGDDESKPFFDIEGGYERLPHELAKQAAASGASVSTHATLTSLNLPHKPGALFKLRFRDARGRQSETTATYVILALPQRAINLIGDFPARASFANLMDSVVPVGACKSFLLYPKPWWKGLGIAGGRSITDLPARQFYLYGAEKERVPAAESTNGHGLLMAYNDATTVEYWKGIVPKPAPDAQGLSWLKADTQLAQEIHREANLVFRTKAPTPLAACFQDWTADPFGAGWHFWGPGHDGFEVADAMLRPIASANLFVCGEAWSLDQGWVEGALERTEMLLQKHFGLPKPNWI